MIGLVASLTMVGCFDDKEGADDAAMSAGPATTVDGSEGGNGMTSTSSNDSLGNNESDAGGADYGGPEWDDTGTWEPGTTGGEEESDTDTTTGGEDPSTDTGGTTSDPTTGGEEGPADTGFTTMGNATTDGGGADYGGAPPDEDDFPI